MATRALVLGGGGPVGIAWESGLISGFAQRGVDLAGADFILGTSAGAFVGARLAMGAEAGGLVNPILRETPRAVPEAEARPAADLSELAGLMAEAYSGVRNPTEVRARIGELALAAETMSEEAFLASFGRSFAGLPPDAWPEKNFACTAVDAETGAFRLWTRGAGAGVTRAVAASCSVPGVFPPITINGRRYMDGGMRSPTNADMAVGYDVVVVISVIAGEGAGAGGAPIRVQLDQEIATLQDGGATVVVVAPDDASATAMGPNLMDFARRTDAARAGLAQGHAQAVVLKEAWGQGAT